MNLSTSGTYTFTLVDQIDHATGAAENTVVINFGSLIVATDFDGDSVTATGALNITVQDDVPIATAATISGAVEEEALVGGNQDASDVAGVTGTVASGSVSTLFSVGADEPLTYLLTASTAGLTLAGARSRNTSPTSAIPGSNGATKISSVGSH